MSHIMTTDDRDDDKGNRESTMWVGEGRKGKKGEIGSVRMSESRLNVGAELSPINRYG